jgi:hypothetical protein
MEAIATTGEILMVFTREQLLDQVSDRESVCVRERETDRPRNECVAELLLWF